MQTQYTRQGRSIALRSYLSQQVHFGLVGPALYLSHVSLRNAHERSHVRSGSSRTDETAQTALCTVRIGSHVYSGFEIVLASFTATVPNVH